MKRLAQLRKEVKKINKNINVTVDRLGQYSYMVTDNKNFNIEFNTKTYSIDSLSNEEFNSELIDVLAHVLNFTNKTGWYENTTSNN